MNNLSRLLMSSALCAVCTMANAQQVNVSGVIKDATGETVIGASVMVKGTKTGTVTDFDGRFHVECTPGATLVISYIGYQTQEVKAADGMNVVLQEAANDLNEVVVTGYTTQRKADLTGAISVVSVDDIAKQNENNPIKALQGRVPGMNISADGSPSGTATVRIRGIGTLNNNDPLYIVDGIPTKAGMHELNGNDIESIQVLKDAASASIYGSRAANGVIIITTKMVYIPASLDIKNLTPTIAYSENATISPASGIATDFTNPVTYTVNNNTANSTYTVTVKQINKPQALYVGLAQNMSELNPEEETACKWMLENIPNSLYASFTDIKNGSIDLSECKVIWWHFHKDGGVDGKSNFEKDAPEALEAIPQLKDFYKNGGSFLFTRYATNMPGELGIAKNGGVPNNCWGQVEADAETCGGPWDFKMTGHTDHALYQNLVKGDDGNSVYTTDTDYRITNSTAQWHIGSDWGGYADYAAWREATGGIDLGYGGDGSIVVWEFPAEGTSGKTLCIGSGCYDWYSVNENYTEKFHKNIAIMTANAFNYLMNK